MLHKSKSKHLCLRLITPKGVMLEQGPAKEVGVRCVTRKTRGGTCSPGKKQRKKAEGEKQAAHVGHRRELAREPEREAQPDS